LCTFASHCRRRLDIYGNGKKIKFRPTEFKSLAWARQEQQQSSQHGQPEQVFASRHIAQKVVQQEVEPFAFVGLEQQFQWIPQVR
jgi:hypothetical protein